MPQAPSARWCPTPEQLMILEEVYGSGVRTPSASQIQHITAHLSSYGKIEGKNVFYWFQNHKARDRQKLKRLVDRHRQVLQRYQMDPRVPLLHQMGPPFSSLHHHQISPHLLQQGCTEEAHEAMNLIGKLEAYEGEEDLESSVASSVVIPCCRPLVTLELFPTRSTGLGEEGSISKSCTSCSTSTN